jgi:hypothetical protein
MKRPPTGHPDYATWMNKTAVCTALNVSPRTVEALQKDGSLRFKLWKRPTGGPAIVVFDPATVTAVLERRQAAALRGIVLPPAPVTTSATPTVGSATALAKRESDPLLERFLERFAGLPPASVPLTELAVQLMLTIEEAARLSRVPIAELRRAIKDDRL